MLRFSILSALVFSLFSCKSKVDFSAEVKLADSLRTEIRSAAAEFYKIDSARVEKAAGTVDGYLRYITENLKDTISKEEAVLLSDFKGVKKSFGKYEKSKKHINKYYGYNVKQLENLSHDLKENIIEVRDSAQKYLAAEQSANAELVSLMKLHTQIIPSELTRFDSLKGKVEELIRKINKGTVPPDLLKNVEKVEDDD
jgi:hypothetical protein